MNSLAERLKGAGVQTAQQPPWTPAPPAGYGGMTAQQAQAAGSQPPNLAAQAPAQAPVQPTQTTPAQAPTQAPTQAPAQAPAQPSKRPDGFPRYRKTNTAEEYMEKVRAWQAKNPGIDPTPFLPAPVAQALTSQTPAVGTTETAESELVPSASEPASAEPELVLVPAEPEVPKRPSLFEQLAELSDRARDLGWKISYQLTRS